MRQKAYDAFASVKTPELASLQVQLDKQVQQGTLTPEQAEVQLLKSNAFNNIQTDPSLGAAQHQALEGLQEVAGQGGMTAIDKARMQDITDEQNATARGRLGAIQSNANERGVGGSGLELASALQNEQSAADRASKQGTDVAANAQARALQALQASGQMASGMEAQQYGEQAQKAGSQNAIDKFNNQTLNANNLYNTQQANAAQQANLGEKQRVADTNVAIGNQQQTHNAAANQTLFDDNAQKAAGEAGIFTGWANNAQANKDKEIGADQALFGGAVNAGAKAGATAIGGPVAGAAAPSIVPNTASGASDPTKRETVFESRGGKVPGIAPVPGDSPKNDIVDAKLSPGEIVAPRSATTDEGSFEDFMNQFKPKKKPKDMTKERPETQALADLHKRVSKLEGK